jgi:Protein of unknown function (DUF4058)
MPVHDWTRISAGGFHDFHQDWTVEIRRTLNRLLPAGYSAVTDLKVMGYEPDVTAMHPSPHPPPGGVAVADAPPRSRLTARAETDAAAYARRANRILVQHEFGSVVAVIEVVSPGNKESRNGIREFTTKAVDYLRRGVNMLVIDLFPPTTRDPNGLPRLIWDELSAVPLDPLPAEQPLAVAAFDACGGLTAYVEPLAVGHPLPDAPLFLTAGWYVNVPLERTYSASWAELPPIIRDRVQPPAQ